MKIITPGILPGETEYVKTCPSCRCLFEFQQKETKEEYDQREGHWRTVKCPMMGCNQTMSVTDKDRRPK